MAEKYPKCPFNALECFAITGRSKQCKALENTDFKLWKGCPFYKHKSQVKPFEEKKEEENDEL